MPVNGEIVMTPELYRAVIKAVSVKVLRGQRIFGALLAVAGVLLLLTGEADVRIVAAGLVAGGLAVLLLLPWRSLSLSVTRAAPALTAPWRWAIDADTIVLTTPLATSEWTWQSLVSFEDYPDFWLLRTQLKNIGVAIAKGAFSPADQQTIAAIGAGKFAGTGNPAR